MTSNIQLQTWTCRQACLVGITSLLLAGLCFGQAPGSPADWTEFHRTNMERRNPYEHVLKVHNVGRLGPKWSYYTGNHVEPSPAVAKGVIYVGSEGGNLIEITR